MSQTNIFINSPGVEDDEYFNGCKKVADIPRYPNHNAWVCSTPDTGSTHGTPILPGLPKPSINTPVPHDLPKQFSSDYDSDSDSLLEQISRGRPLKKTITKKRDVVNANSLFENSARGQALLRQAQLRESEEDDIEDDGWTGGQRGGFNESYYKHKYLKYKLKYLNSK
jgi:hypothetical protein